MITMTPIIKIDVADIGELVDRYYHNPEDYFHFNDSRPAEAVTNNIMYGCQVLQNHLKTNFFQQGALEILHPKNVEIASESQQISNNDIENITENSEVSRKLSDEKNISQSLSFSAKTEDTLHGQELELSANNLEEWWQNERKKITPLDHSHFAPTGVKCYYCEDFETDSLSKDGKRNYESHVKSKHGDDLDHPCYPTKADIERLRLKAQGKNWEI